MVEEKEKARPGESDKLGLVAVVALVIVLGVIVWLALPKNGDPAAAADAAAAPSSASGERLEDAGAPALGKARHGTLERLREATSELAILTDKPEVEVAQLASAEAVAKLLDVRHCGATCDALKKQIVQHEHFEVEVIKSEDYILPPKGSYETIAAGLTASERATIGQRASTVVVRTRGQSTIDQLPARTAFAATAALAEALSGLVYDEVVRRIETASQFSERVITVPMGQNVFSPKHISVQLYREEDGSAHLLTLGMVRFGSPDFTMRGATMAIGASLANVMNAAASWAAAAKTELPIIVTLPEVARVSARTPEQLAKDPTERRPVQLDTADIERSEGDPENDMLELLPPGGATAEAWAKVVDDLFGERPKLVFAAFDKELEAIAVRARRELPSAVKRFEHGDGKLYVKGPFPIPEASRIDGGAKSEWMWVEVSSCDARSCSGVLTNAPAYATNLSAGKTVSVPREKTADWLLRQKDGGAVGGESIKVLEKQ